MCEFNIAILKCRLVDILDGEFSANLNFEHSFGRKNNENIKTTTNKLRSLSPL